MSEDVYEINDADIALAVEIYKINTNQINQAKKLYYRSSRSWLACCKLIKSKAQTN